MKSANASARLGLMALAILSGTCALAQDTGWYGGANIGRSLATIDDDRIRSGLAAGGLGVTGISDRDRDTGFKIYGGYQINRYLAVEGGFFDLGKFGYTATTTPAGRIDGEMKVRGLNLDAVGMYPINDRLTALGRVGVNRARTRDSFSGSGAVSVTNPSPSSSGTHYKLGLGAQYAFTPALGLRAEVERYRVNDAVGNRGDIDMFSVGLVYRFGGRTPTPANRLLSSASSVVTPVTALYPPGSRL